MEAAGPASAPEVRASQVGDERASLAIGQVEVIIPSIWDAIGRGRGWFLISISGALPTPIGGA